MSRLVFSHLEPKSIVPSPNDGEDVFEPVKDLLDQLHMMIPQLGQVTADQLSGKTAEDAATFLQAEAHRAYEQLEQVLTDVAQQLQADHGISLSGMDDPALMTEEDVTRLLSGKSEAQLAELRHPLRRIERDILLTIVDAKWIEYLHGLDALRDGIGLRAYGQKDPLIEYKLEAYAMFQQLTYDIQRETVSLLFRTRIEIQIPELAQTAEGLPSPPEPQPVPQNGSPNGQVLPSGLWVPSSSTP
jgi:preprotein translocase subunit SecA